MIVRDFVIRDFFVAPFFFSEASSKKDRKESKARKSVRFAPKFFASISTRNHLELNLFPFTRLLNLTDATDTDHVIQLDKVVPKEVADGGLIKHFFILIDIDFTD